MDDNRRFDSYRASPSPEALISLLKANENTIYNLCFQVLRHPQDAEDAAQKVLLEILNAIPEMTSGEHFKRWIYRTCYFVALTMRKSTRRRRGHEKKKAETMDRATHPPSQDAAEAIHESIYALSDEDRALVVDHYFEQKSLETLGVENGCSKVAIWKRLEKAKETLKQSLLRHGPATLAPAIEPFLQSIVRVPAPPGLITKSIAAKAAVVSAGGSLKSTLVIGGFAVKLKVVSLSAVLALGALLPLSYMVVQHREARRLAADRGAVVARAALSTTTKFTPPEAPRPSGATTGARLEIGPSQRETAPADPAQAGEIELRGPVGASIKWFISVQNPDGSWGNGSTTLNGHPMDKVGMTGLSLLAFLGAGYTTLSYDRCSGVKLGDVVKNSIQFLTRDQSEDGSFQSSRDVVEQALAALALCEGYAMTASESLKGPARKALNALQAAQKEDGSWGDLYQSLWSSYVLVSGRLGDLALEGDRYKLSQSYFRGQLDAGPNLPAMIGSLLINKDRSHPAIAETVARLSATPPDWSQQDFSYWYMGSMAMFQYDGPDGEIWKAWSRRFKQTLIPFQQKEGYWAGADANSTLVQTALGTLSLQVYYRYANVLGSPK